jgi:hypothetical protein
VVVGKVPILGASSRGVEEEQRVAVAREVVMAVVRQRYEQSEVLCL